MAQRNDKPFLPHNVQKCTFIKFWRLGRPFPVLLNSVVTYQLIWVGSVSGMGQSMTWVAWVNNILAWVERRKNKIIIFNHKTEFGRGSCVHDVRKKPLNLGQQIFTKSSFVKD